MYIGDLLRVVKAEIFGLLILRTSSFGLLLRHKLECLGTIEQLKELLLTRVRTIYLRLANTYAMVRILAGELKF